MAQVGYNGTPVNDRWFPTERLIGVFANTRNLAQLVERLGYDPLWTAEHHFQREGYECIATVLRLNVYLEAIQVARQRQETVGFKVQYALRVGVESSLSQGSRRFDLRWSRDLGLARTHLQQLLNATAMNGVRAIAWLGGEPIGERRWEPGHVTPDSSQLWNDVAKPRHDRRCWVRHPFTDGGQDAGQDLAEGSHQGAAQSWRRAPRWPPPLFRVRTLAY